MRHPNLSILRPWWRPHRARSGDDVGSRWQALLDHFALVAGLLLVVCALLWAIGEHNRHKAALRMAETNRYVAAFQSPPVADAWRRLSGAWHAQQARQSVLLRRIAALSGAPLQAELRNYRAFVLDTIVERDLAPDIDTMVRFYRRLAACVRIGSCNASLTAGRFGSAAWSFRNQHYYYLQEVHDVDEIDRVLDVIAPRAGEQRAAEAS